MSDLVKFFALINNKFFRLHVSRELILDEIYATSVVTDPLIADHIPSDVLSSSCKFYRLRNPVPLPGPNTDEELEIRRKSCVDETNRVEVTTMTYVRDLGKNFSAESVMLVIDVPLAHRKRPREESSIARRIKSAKINEYNPTSIGSAEYREMQGKEEWRMLDCRKVVGDVGRVTLDDKVPPISLLYQPFGEFLDTYLGYSGNRGLGPLGKVSVLMKQKVDEFATAAAMIYSTEEDRNETCLHLLNQIFFTVIGTDHRSLTPGTSSEPKTDGHNTTKDGKPICIVQFKNELVGINSIPIAQLSRYYIELIQMAKTYPDILSYSKMPTLGITVVGPVITFYAIVCLDGKFHYTSLTPGLSCVRHTTGGEDRKGLYRAFSAACTLLRRRATSSELSTPPLDFFYPVITELPSINPSQAEPEIQFTINGSYVVKPGRYVYRATCSDQSELVIKFTFFYSLDLHKHCAGQGHAPRLRGFARLPGGIYGIAMDDVGDDAREMKASDPLDDREKWATQLQLLMKSFHAMDYVHGDLRSPNILIVEGNVMLVDFDWGGREGEVEYPHDPLASELTVGRNQDDQKIRKRDDERVLRLTLGQNDVDIVDK